MLSIAWTLLLDTAPFVLVGFAIAAVLDGLLSAERWLGKLRGEGLRATAAATLMGAPLPLCSCSVLPAALTLRRRGLGRGPTLSFLVSTPETSVTSVLLSYSLLGPVFAVVRPLAAVATAISAGLVEGAFGRRDDGAPDDVADDDAAACCDDDDCHTLPLDDAPPAPLADRVRRGARFAFVDLFDDLFGWIVVGILFAAALQTWVPDESFAALFSSPLLTMLAVVLLGVPLYVCAEASTPIAAAFVAEGMSPGAALVFLLVGPATNLGSLGALSGVFGRRSIALYLVSIVVIAVLLGVGVDVVLGADAVSGVVAADERGEPSTFALLSTFVFLALGVASLARTRVLDRTAEALDRVAPFAVGRRLAAGVVVAFATLGWLATGVHVVPPGHVAVVERFGVVVAEIDEPGPLLRWPAPIERVDIVDVATVRRSVIDDAWSLTADEDLGDLDVVVHWRPVASAARLASRTVADPEALVVSLARAALRERVASTPIAAALTTGRAALERHVRDTLTAYLARHDAALVVEDVAVVSAHAPDAVHDAFRDVAGALERRDTSIARAEARRARTLPLADADATSVRQAALARAARATAEARARAARFVELAEATRTTRDVTRRRLELEMLERVLPRLRKYLGDEALLDVWFTTDPATPPARR